MKTLEKVTRLEVITEEGRVLMYYGVSVDLLYQDNGRTLKIVLKDSHIANKPPSTEDVSSRAKNE
tara:strand:- start:352 stop:546 length:195 start_codon:yes stop_codon:yes gene_type:complete